MPVDVKITTRASRTTPIIHKHNTRHTLIIHKHNTQSVGEGSRSDLGDRHFEMTQVLRTPSVRG